MRVFSRSLIFGRFVCSKLSEHFSHESRTTKLGISVLVSAWAARSFHYPSPCAVRGSFVSLYLYSWTEHDYCNAHDSSISRVAPALQVTLLRIWGICHQLLSHPCWNVRFVLLHGMPSAAESLCVDYTASLVFGTLSKCAQVARSIHDV